MWFFRGPVKQNHEIEESQVAENLWIWVVLVYSMHTCHYLFSVSIQHSKNPSVATGCWGDVWGQDDENSKEKLGCVATRSSMDRSALLDKDPGFCGS
jgi:hypothetical protein